MKARAVLPSLLFTTLLFSAASHGVSIGVGTFTINTAANTVIDTEADLEWLRWDQTLNMSINDADLAFPSFQVASSTQLRTLFDNVSDTFGDGLFTANHQAQTLYFANHAQEFIQYFGLTHGDTFSRALFVNSAETGYRLAEASYAFFNSQFTIAESDSTNFTTSTEAGIALVRAPQAIASPVPLPGAAYLFMTAFATLFLSRRRQRT